MLKTKIDGWLKDRIWRESLLSMRQAELKCKTLPRLNLMSHGGRFCFIVAEPVGTHLFFRVHRWIILYSLPCSWMQPYAWSGQCKMSRAMWATSGLAHKHHSSKSSTFFFSILSLIGWRGSQTGRSGWRHKIEQVQVLLWVGNLDPPPLPTPMQTELGCDWKMFFNYINKLRFWCSLL